MDTHGGSITNKKLLSYLLGVDGCPARAAAEWIIRRNPRAASFAAGPFACRTRAEKTLSPSRFFLQRLMG
jgi:hypothetical protein